MARIWGCFKSQEFCLQVPFVYCEAPKQQAQSKTWALHWDIGITCEWNVIHDMCNAVNALCMWANFRARGCNTESSQESQPNLRRKTCWSQFWIYTYAKVCGYWVVCHGLPPSILQSVRVANPSIKEPVRVAFTTIAVIVQSIAQNETSNVVHNDRVVNV